jgi:zinc protease
VSKTTRTTLSNGLTVILREAHAAPVISWWVAYRIGSRNERSGQTGISHWVEHMMFKGTDEFPAGMLDRKIDRVGGQWNAFTSTDFTMYFETLPAEHVELAMRAEADRMINAQFDPDETESERTVIISERGMIENQPTFWLGEAMRATAFRVHGYHHEIIGDTADLHSITRDDLYEHYRKHYTPSNASIVAVGAFDTDEMLKKIEAIYGDIPDQGEPQLFVRAEPPQIGERRITVERPGTTAFVRVAQRVPQATHDDWFKLEILDSVLTGPGGGVDNKTSRLYQALVKTGVAAGISGGLQESIDPYLYTVGVTVNDGRTPEEAEAVVLREFERLSNEGITQAELDKAKKQARAAFAYGTETVTNQAYFLAQSEILGDYTWFDKYVEKLAAVTVADVQAAAQKYLQPRTRTTGWLVPVNNSSSNGHEANQAAAEPQTEAAQG